MARIRATTRSAASAAELSSILDLLDLLGGPDRQSEPRRISQMVHKLR